MGEEIMSIKSFVSGVIAPAKLVYAKGMNETSEFSFSALAGSLSSRLIRFVCLFVLLFASVEASAQNTTATISGSVKDTEGEPLQAAAVLVTSYETGAFYGTVTNRFGIFSLSGLKPGNYLVKVSFLGYQEVSYDNVTLSLGKDYSLNVVLTEETLSPR